MTHFVSLISLIVASATTLVTALVYKSRGDRIGARSQAMTLPVFVVLAVMVAVYPPRALLTNGTYAIVFAVATAAGALFALGYLVFVVFFVHTPPQGASTTSS